MSAADDLPIGGDVEGVKLGTGVIPKLRGGHLCTASVDFQRIEGPVEEVSVGFVYGPKPIQRLIRVEHADATGLWTFPDGCRTKKLPSFIQFQPD